jgi:hypothetical protein
VSDNQLAGAASFHFLSINFFLKSVGCKTIKLFLILVEYQYKN